MSTRIGFIGQGWIGKHYADNFETRGHEVVRYALEAPYNQNKAAISECTIVFIAVPTPSTPDGFCYPPVHDALSCIAPGTTVVIKSTLLPGTTAELQAAFPELYVMHSPEFLREASAAHDAAHPDRNLIGIPETNDAYRTRAESVLAVLPSAPYSRIMPCYEAELVKYGGNCFLYTKVIFMNAFYDLVQANKADWDVIREAMVQDPRIGDSHTQPIHASGHDSDGAQKCVRGAGGHCFIKDFEAFSRFYRDMIGDDAAHRMLEQMIAYNNHLLVTSGKDLDILTGVYGEDVVQGQQQTK